MGAIEGYAAVFGRRPALVRAPQGKWGVSACMFPPLKRSFQVIAEYVLAQRVSVGIGHTLDFREPLSPNTPMSAVLFAVAEGIDTQRIRRCTRAQEILNVVPITEAELNFVRHEGIGALLDRFEAAAVQPVFDCWRASSV